LTVKLLQLETLPIFQRGISEFSFAEPEEGWQESHDLRKHFLIDYLAGNHGAKCTSSLKLECIH